MTAIVTLVVWFDDGGANTNPDTYSIISRWPAGTLHWFVLLVPQSKLFTMFAKIGCFSGLTAVAVVVTELNASNANTKADADAFFAFTTLSHRCLAFTKPSPNGQLIRRRY